MTKLVLDVGNCPPDHAAIKSMIEATFDARVAQAHAGQDALQSLQQNVFALVLVNRKLDQDYSDGLEVVRLLKETPETAPMPVMMVTNLEEHQQLAIESGAERGFGKLSLHDPSTRARLAKFLEP